jgi:hypothetical protein
MSRPTSASSENTRTVVGWKAGMGARLRAEPEVGSESGRVWMVETVIWESMDGIRGCKATVAQRTMTDHMNRIISKNRKAEKKLGLLEKSGCGAPFLKQNLEAARRHKRLFS